MERGHGQCRSAGAIAPFIAQDAADGNRTFGGFYATPVGVLFCMGMTTMASLSGFHRNFLKARDLALGSGITVTCEIAFSGRWQENDPLRPLVLLRADHQAQTSL